MGPNLTKWNKVHIKYNQNQIKSNKIKSTCILHAFLGACLPRMPSSEQRLDMCALACLLHACALTCLHACMPSFLFVSWDRQADRQTGRQRQTDRQTDRQTETVVFSMARGGSVGGRFYTCFMYVCACWSRAANQECWWLRLVLQECEGCRWVRWALIFEKYIWKYVWKM